MNKDAISASFDKHRANPNVSTDEYVRAHQITLGEAVMARERIYLDLRYWIILRDVALGRLSDKCNKAILAGLRKRVQSKQSICPISESVFFELLKQNDTDTRLATARLIDELSEGVTLLPYDNRVATEIAHFIYALTEKELHPLSNLVWSKLSYVLGIQHPTTPHFNDEEQGVIQKSFFDHMWMYSLSEMVELLIDAVLPSVNNEAIAHKLNKDNAKYASTMKSFQHVYQAEVRGCLSLFMCNAREVLEAIATPASGFSIRSTESEKQEYERQLLEFFYKKILEKEGAMALRTLHIGALCYAAVRWDQQRKLTGNDLYDFHHAEAAMAYCNLFLTEKPLHTLLQQKHLKLTQEFPCRIISSLSEAADWAAA